MQIITAHISASPLLLVLGNAEGARCMTQKLTIYASPFPPMQLMEPATQVIL
jgi:hypothetical protein